MDFDNDIFRIFSALDSQNQGFIDKNDFIKELLHFLSSSDEIEEKDIVQIEQLMKPYNKIGLDEFKKIYLEIQRLKEDNMQIFDNYKSPESSNSSGSSDIDEFPDKLKIKNIKDGFKSARLSKSSQSSNSESFLMSPNSASRHARELLNNSKESLEKIVSRSLSIGSANIELTDDVDDRFQKEMELMYKNNSRLEDEIKNLKRQLEEEGRRYQAEKDQNKVGNERIYLLESTIHDLKMCHKDEMKKVTEDWKNKLTSMEESVDQVSEDLKIRYAEIEKRLFVSCNESANLLLRCEELTHENENLLREGQILRTQIQDNEIIMLEYKKVAGKQVTELQTERDQLEVMNMQLYNEIQTIKHLSPSKSSQPSPIDKTEAALRTRSMSEYISPNKSIKIIRKSEYNTRKESHIAKDQPGSIESDTNRVVHLLTMENRNLVERIAHLETVVYYQREKLESSNCLSLAAEMEQLNVEELKKALTVEREAVKSLQKYVESLIHRLLVAGHIDVFQQLP